MEMEIAAKTGVTYQGSASQTDNKATVQGETQSTQVTADDSNTAVGTADAAGSSKKSDAVIGEVQSRDTIKRAVDEINKKTNTEAVWGVHDKTNRITIKIVDKDTKKVIREYPPEETLDMIAKVWEMAGILVDEKR